MFSVVIPLYNKANYIEKAIDSVLSQTFSDYELIVIDDGSTDNGLEKLACIVDERLRVITQANAGVSVARNTGVKNARFSHVAFLDADDWWDIGFLAEMRELITTFPDAGMYGSSYYVVKNGTPTPARVGVESDFRVGYVDYFAVYARTFWVPINCSFVVVEKSAFEQAGGFRPALKFGEDFDLWVRMALQRKVAYLNKPLSYSNQDVEAEGRALGKGKIWRMQEHFIFNLGFLAQEEKKHLALKSLLDGLRVRSLTDFYLNSRFPETTRQILDKVDFAKQPPLYRFIYQWPKWIVSTYFGVKQFGSNVKQASIRSIHKYSIK